MPKLELKPCPFCGSEYTQVRWIGFTHTHNGAFEAGYRGECAECFAITRAYNTAEEAAKAWNERTPEVSCHECRHAKIEGGILVCQLRYPYCFTVNPGDYCSRAEVRHA